MQENASILITVPSFKKQDDVVHYQLNLEELQRGYNFTVEYRYSDLKRLNEQLETLKVQLPKFPGTQWWRNTNANPELIEHRRQQLDSFFRNLNSSKIVRDSLILKNFIIDAQKERDKKIEKMEKQKIKEEGGQVSLKSKSKFNTPACQPMKSPILEPVGRSQSYEKNQPKKERINIAFGGVKTFRGILANPK
ncbi:hypothetical protein pb186bvf_017231 [Paramecium bursaria]